MEVLAEGFNFSDFPTDTTILREGEEGEIRVYLSEQLSRDELRVIQDELLRQGVVLTSSVYVVSNVLVIPFRKEFDPLGTIKTVLDFITTPFQIAWQIIKTTSSIPWWAWIGGIGIGAYLLLSSETLQEEVRETKRVARQAAMAYVTKGVLK